MQESEKISGEFFRVTKQAGYEENQSHSFILLKCSYG